MGVGRAKGWGEGGGGAPSRYIHWRQPDKGWNEYS